MLKNPRPFGLLAQALVWTLALPALTAQNTPGTKLKIEVVEGEGALNDVQNRRAKEPVVRVLDANEQPLRGATVNFMLPELGASGVFPASGTNLTIQTDENGRATARGLQPNNIAGPFQIRVTASWRGQTASAVINQTNIARAAVKRSSSKKIAIIVVIAGGGAVGALLAARGGGSSSTPAQPPTPTPTTTITPGSGSFGPPH